MRKDMSKNVIKGRLVVNENVLVEVPLYKQEMVDLAVSKDINAWDQLCELIISQGFMDLRGNVHIDQLVIDGKERVFH